MKLPNGERAEVNLQKLEQYSLNPNHEAGGHKARVFRAALGLTIQDAGWLRERVLQIAVEGNAIVGSLSPFGKKYVVDAKITHNERATIVRTVWMIENGKDFPRLVTCYVK